MYVIKKCTNIIAYIRAPNNNICVNQLTAWSGEHRFIKVIWEGIFLYVPPETIPWLPASEPLL